MTLYECPNCRWKGENIVGPYKNCPICGDNARLIETAPEPKKEENPLDLDKDGDFDKDDKKIAAKVLASGKRKKG